MKQKNKIAVVGSLIIDHYARVERFPGPGETVIADELVIRFGGKGANQAVAAARLGAQVEMIGCLGEDELGRSYRARLNEFGIGDAGVRLVAGVASGSAFVTLDACAENSIVVAPSANSQLDVAQIEQHAALIAQADCLLLQNEVSHDANLTAMSIASENSTRIVYNPAPWRSGFPFDDWHIDVLIVNEVEAAGLFGTEPRSPQGLRPGVVVTRGADPTLANMGGELFEVRPDLIRPVDTVGAGDTFCGALASRLGWEGLAFADLLRFANRAAGLSTQKTGAQ
jgi:ribokinase